MGFRLEGETVHSDIVGMLSEGICHGAIQIPADGQPIVLMNDRQTIGGYPKIGSVIPRDTARLSQLSSGSQVRFEAISIEQAHNIHCLEQARFERTPLQPC
jgi:allophanate hydrolase subunit 2